ncbi:TPA: LamG domain-containing protein [bacterium]|nr:LamG domain-containing protein [bacterium]
MKSTIFLLAILFVVCVSSTYALDKAGMVMYLSFNEGSGTVAKDSSGAGNNGAIMGNVEWIAGKSGKALKMLDDSADNKVVVTANASIDFTDAMSYGGWVNVETLPDGSCSFITKADSYMIHTSNWSGKGVEVEPLNWPFDAWQTPISSPIPFGEWHHVVGTYGNGKLRAYVDGKLINERNFAGPIAVTTNDLVIGRDSRGCCNTRRQLISVDEVFAFNRAITEAEVNELMAGITSAVRPEGHTSTLWGEIKAGR